VQTRGDWRILRVRPARGSAINSLVSVSSVVSTNASLPIGGAGWRYLPAHFVVFTLALLLVSTTPMGTGSGVHQFDLVHPLFAHVHLVNGRMLTHEQMEQGDATPRPPAHGYTAGPAFGAGAGGAPGDTGLGVGPTLPFQPLSLLPAIFGRRFRLQARLPVGRSEAPPDPPPTSAA
jgi:hypothetical protein